MSEAITENNYNKIVNNTQIPTIYKGLNSNFSQDNRQLVLINANDVGDQLLNLISTIPGELDFEPDFGSRVPLLLFEQPIAITNWMIGNYLFIAINKWMPYVTIDFKNSVILPLDSVSGYYFKLLYSVTGLSAGSIDFVLQT